MTKILMRFRIELLGIDPPVWRRILIPLDYSLWDFHVAIQDAMGWLDYHLHAFRVVGSESTYGIPDRNDLPEIIPGWKVETEKVFTLVDPIGMYEYDFGDSWIHLVVFEDYENAEVDVAHPICVAGERRCPPEDCGGPRGYAEFLAIIGDRSHEQHDDMIEWVGGSFKPEEFDASAVRFDDPKERWKKAFGRE